MPWVPDFFIAWLTFPGLILRNVFLRFCCHLTGTKVYSATYFRFTDKPGQILHDQPRGVEEHLWLGFGPFLLCSAVGGTLAAITVALDHQGLLSPPQYAVLIWLAFSALVQSFPRMEEEGSRDMGGFFHTLHSRGAKLLSAPFYALLRAAALSRIFWANIVYAIAICAVAASVF